MATTITEEVYTVEELGFGIWKIDAQVSDSVDYVNLLRNAALRSLSEYVAKSSGSIKHPATSQQSIPHHERETR